MNTDIVIDLLGGVTETAKFFRIKPPSVCGWREHGIPSARLMYLEVARPDVFEAASIPPIIARQKAD